MIVLDMVQGSPEWKAARLGIPTASRFDQIVTPADLKLSKSSEKYRATLVAESHFGYPMDDVSTAYMERGSGLEAEAVKWYEFANDVDVARPGFVLRDDRRVGCSPDGLVGTLGGLEVKCPGAVQHVRTLLGHHEPASATQVQGCLWLCEREWWDRLAFHPTLPPKVDRVYRDDAYIAKLSAAVDAFLELLDRDKKLLAAMLKGGTALEAALTLSLG